MDLLGANKKKDLEFGKLHLISFLNTITLKKYLMLFGTNMASLDPKEIGADQVFSPKYLVSFTTGKAVAV